MTANHGGVRPDARSLSYQSGLELIFARHGAARIDDIGEHAGRPEKHIVFAFHAGIDRNVVLHLDPVAQPYLRGNHHILPDIAILADLASGHDMRKMPYFGACPDLAGRIDDCGGMLKIIGHGALF